MNPKKNTPAPASGYLLLKSLLPPFVRKNRHLRALARILYGKGLYRLLNLAPVSIQPDQSEKIRLLVDVSQIATLDHHTGIQRVTRNLYAALCRQCQPGIEIVPVHASVKKRGWFLAKAGENCSFFEKTATPLRVRSRDIFFGLDHSPAIILAQAAYMQGLHAAGIPLYFMLHDLIPISHPRYFPAGTREMHESWQKMIAPIAEVICVSRHTQSGLAAWCAGKSITPKGLHWVHNGYDGREFSGQPSHEPMPANPFFLLVSTIEPRKGHAQTLAAFELLWAGGVDINLALVGHKGWGMDGFCKKLLRHPQLNRRLLWYDDCDDATLATLYAQATCVLMPSEAEGFGMALIEGAAYGKPLLVRDLPVFWEIAGSHAFYFKGLDARSLAAALRQWLELSSLGQIPASQGIAIPNWDDCARKVLRIMNLGGAEKSPMR